jgi:hypothetical protein
MQTSGREHTNVCEERFPTIYKNAAHGQSEELQLLCRLAPAFFVWFIALGGAYLFFFNPTWLFIISIAVSVYNIQYALVLAWFGWEGLKTLRETLKTNWRTSYQKSLDFTSTSSTDVKGTDPDSVLENQHVHHTINVTVHHGIKWEEVLHYVFLPNYNENEVVLGSTLTHLAKCGLAKSQMVIVLGMEEREEGCIDKAKRLIAEHVLSFKGMKYTVHPKDLPNEVPGKGSNDNYAVRKATENLDNAVKSRIIVTVADADSILHENYFEAITAKFITYDEYDRHNRVYQPIITPYRNLDSVPIIIRVAAMISGLVELAGMSDPRDHHMSYSTYSASLRFIEVYEAWDPTVVSEDNHIYVASFFMSGGKTFVEPIYLPVYTLCVESDTWLSSIWERWIQAKRHSFGICELTFCLRQICAHFTHYTASLPLIRLVSLLYRISMPHFAPIVQVVFAVLPAIFTWFYGRNGYVSEVLERMFAAMQTWVVVAYFICYAINFKQLMEVMPDRKPSIYKFIKYYIEWILLGPLANILIAAIPAVIAVHQLILSEKYVFIRSSKVIVDRSMTDTPKGFKGR